MSTAEKNILNDLLSRFDTLHDFCDPSPDTTRNKDQTINQKDRQALSDEFANIFKPEILKALENESSVRAISKKELLKNVNGIIDITTNIPTSLKPYYKTDLVNLIDRVKNGLILVNYLKINGKEVFTKTDRLSNFEPTVVAFFEYIYNALFQKQRGIGKFISNMNLPIFDYINSEYKILDNGKYNTIQVSTQTDNKLTSFIQICTTNKESIISFILGTINESESGDIFLSPEDTSGFYKFSTLSIPKKSKRTDVDKQNLSELYFRYLKDIRYILGQYFNKDESAMIYLIVDTTNISFSKYYKELLPEQRKTLKMMVLCNVAMSWDGATSPECQQKSSKTGEEEIIHNKVDINRAIYDIDILTLKDKAGSTVVKFDSAQEIDSKPVPREVGQLSECIRQQIDKDRKKTKECNNFKTKGRLFDIKRSGDALQALMAKKLNDKDVNSSDLYIFVTLDHLAFLKARLNGIPSIFTSTMKEKKSSIRNRVMILFNNTFEKNYKAIGIQLEQEFSKFSLIQKNIDDNFPLILFKKELKEAKEKESYFRFFLMLDYFTRSLFGIVLFIRPKIAKLNFEERIRNKLYEGEEFNNEEFINQSNYDDNQTIITSNLKLLLQDYVIHDTVKNNCKIQFYQTYFDNSLYTKLQTKIKDSIDSTITKLNNLVNNAKDELMSIATRNGQLQFKFEDNAGLLDANKIKDIFEQFILNTFIIECFYTLKRAGVFVQYFEDLEKVDIDIYGSDINNLAETLQKEPMQDQDAVIKASNYIEVFKSMNKKYCMYTRGMYTYHNETVDALSYFFDNYSYTNDNEFKGRLTKLFDMNFDEYIEFVESLLGELEVVFNNNIMKTHINLYVNKFKEPDYFNKPIRPTRTMLRVEEKMIECMNQFNLPNMLQRTYQDLIYNRMHNNVEGFYKSKMAELHLGNLTNKTISFQKAMAKIIDDEIKVRQSELPNRQEGGTDKKEVSKSNIHTGGYKNYDEKDIEAYRNILLNKFIYDPDNYIEYPWKQYDLINIDLYKKYNHFLIEIFDKYNYLPKYYEIDSELLVNMWKSDTEWNMPGDLPTLDILNTTTNVIEFKYLIDLWHRRILGNTMPLSKFSITDIENFDTNNTNKLNFIKHKMQKFTYDLVSDLIKQSVDTLYNIIEYVYVNKINYSLKDNDPRFDMVFWMMINDPAILLYHPNRKPEWSAYEQNILDNAIGEKMLFNPDDRVIYEGGVVPRRPLQSIINELMIQSVNKYKIRKEVPVNYNILHGRIDKVRRDTIKQIRQPRQPQDINEDNMNIEIPQYINEDMNVEIPQDIPHDTPHTDHVRVLQVINDNLPHNSKSEHYNEYCTLDEYAAMKCIFQKEKYLLKTNLAILSFLDTKTGLLRDTYGNMYNFDKDGMIPGKIPGRLQAHEILSTDKESFIKELVTEPLSTQTANTMLLDGGGFKGYLSLSNYHQKYYKKYYELYYNK